MVEDIAHGMFVQPAYDIGMGVGSVVGGQGWNSPEAGAGLMAAMSLLTPIKAGALAPRAGIKAYHGSPRDFDRFDLSEIGTGEGAQAYGHGLYFAENPKVAQHYKDVLSSRKGQLGKMYEVNINAKPEEFMDWDVPIGGTLAYPKLRHIIYDLPKRNDFGRVYSSGMDMPGEAIYQNLIDLSGSEIAASNIIREAGIPGITYLDQGSRLTGQAPTQTSNYVLFRDDIIDILKKWSLLGALGSSAAAISTKDQQ